MTQPNIDASALEEAISEIKDERFQQQMREWLVMGAPREVTEIWARYVEKMEAKEERTARLREEYVKDQQLMTVWLRVIAMGLLIAVVLFTFDQLYQVLTAPPGCAR